MIMLGRNLGRCEVHVTVLPEHLVNVKRVLAYDSNRSFFAAARFRVWHTSQIAGDDELGVGKHAYITAHFDSYALAAHEMQALCTALELAGVSWVRRKVEHILFDERIA